MTGTGLLTQRCDPYGIEGGDVRLAGGMYPSSMMGKNIWYCQEQAQGFYRMVCRGGSYGFRRANDGGHVDAYRCDGGHQGQRMPLCKTHVREFSTFGSRSAGKPLDTPWIDSEGKEQWWKPSAMLGGSRANEMCPACLTGRGTQWEQEIRGRMETADALQQELSRLQIAPAFLMPQAARVQAMLDQERARLDELNERGIIHKCPLKLVEVS